MSWIPVAQITLLLFLAVSVTYLAVVYRRRSRQLFRSRVPVRPNPNPVRIGGGDFAPTPLPDWAYEDWPGEQNYR